MPIFGETDVFKYYRRTLFAVNLIVLLLLSSPVVADEQLSISKSKVIPPVVSQVTTQHKTIYAGGSEEITVKVTDDAGIKSVTFYYREVGENTYKHKTMLQIIGSDKYSAVMDHMPGKGLEYYIQAVDNAGNSTLHGYSFSPLVIDVVYKTSISYSWNPGFYILSIDDPQGSTKTANVISLLSGALSYNYTQDRRLYIDAHYLDFSVDPGVNKIGQGVTSYQLGCSNQYKLQISNILLWAGIGVLAQKTKFTQRYTVDSDGYALAHYPDRNSTSIGLQLSMQSQWKLFHSLSLGARGALFYTPNNGISGMNLAAMLVF